MAKVLPFTRDQQRSRRHREVRAKTASLRQITKRTLTDGRVHLLLLEEDGLDLDDVRPRTRGECVDMPRPCPWVSCQHNLYLDVSDDTGSIKFNFPDLEPGDVPPAQSCALDVAEQGGATLEDIARTMNVTRERVRQMEGKALFRLHRAAKTQGRAAHALADFVTTKDDALAGRAGGTGKSVFAESDAAPAVEADAAEHDDDDAPTRISFFAEGERADALVCNAVWNMFAKASNARGISCRSRGSLAATRTLVRMRDANGEAAQVKPPKHIEEKPMVNGTHTNGASELTPRLAAVLAAYNELVAAGERPTGMAVANKAKLSGENDNARAANAAGAIKALKVKGLIGDAAMAPAPRPEPTATRKSSPPRKPRPEVVERRPRRAKSSDPFVAALIEQRDALLSQAKQAERRAAAPRQGHRDLLGGALMLVYVAAPFIDGPFVRLSVHDRLREIGATPTARWVEHAAGIESFALHAPAKLRQHAAQNDADLRGSDVALVLARPGGGGEMFAEARLALEWGKSVVWCGDRLILSAWRSGVVRVARLDEAFAVLAEMQRRHVDGVRGHLLAHLAGNAA